MTSAVPAPQPSARPRLSPTARDRALGAVLGAAVGDALGAPYEFSTTSPGMHLAGTASDLIGGGVMTWEPGEWTDDTAMAVVVLRELAAGGELASDPCLDRIVAGWTAWAADAPDVGVQTRQVLAGVHSAAEARSASRELHERTGRSAGNGSLMRTSPVALAYLADADGDERTAAAARALSELTHWDSDAGDACVIWSVAIRHAILRGYADLERGVGLLPPERQERWRALVAHARSSQPGDFPKNGWVVHAFQAAVASLEIAGVLAMDASPGGGERTLHAIEAAINAAGDTDTVACIVGQLAGAEAGASTLHGAWLAGLHGWPGMDGGALAALAAKAMTNAGSGSAS